MRRCFLVADALHRCVRRRNAGCKQSAHFIDEAACEHGCYALIDARVEHGARHVHAEHHRHERDKGRSARLHDGHGRAGLLEHLKGTHDAAFMRR